MYSEVIAEKIEVNNYELLDKQYASTALYVIYKELANDDDVIYLWDEYDKTAISAITSQIKRRDKTGIVLVEAHIVNRNIVILYYLA